MINYGRNLLIKREREEKVNEISIVTKKKKTIRVYNIYIWYMRGPVIKHATMRLKERLLFAFRSYSSK